MFDIDDVIQNDLDPSKMEGLIERCMLGIHGVDTPRRKQNGYATCSLECAMNAQWRLANQQRTAVKAANSERPGGYGQE